MMDKITALPPKRFQGLVPGIQSMPMPGNQGPGINVTANVQIPFVELAKQAPTEHLRSLYDIIVAELAKRGEKL